MEESILKSTLILLSLTMVTACQSALSGSKPVSAGDLADEYQRSSAGVRSRYDGKEVTVRGYTPIAATMPSVGTDQGSVALEEKGLDPPRQVTCWFSKDQAAEFSRIKSGQYLTVKGVFNGEAGAELKFCRVVRVE